jgi:DNA-binding transcriptional MocR family regulator
LSALYVQPIIQNPLGMTMPSSRRADLLRVVEKLDLTVIEDAVYAFLDDEPPLAALAPDRCVVLDSLSKKVAPGLSLGFVVPPLRLRENVMAAVRSGGWTASGFAFAAAQRLMDDGTAAELSRLKRIDAQQRQKIAVACLSGLEIQTNSKSYHLWLTLPPHWRSQTFVAAAARRDIALTPSTTCHGRALPFGVITGVRPPLDRRAESRCLYFDSPGVGCAAAERPSSALPIAPAADEKSSLRRENISGLLRATWCSCAWP